jgi:hypothetical protein
VEADRRRLLLLLLLFFVLRYSCFPRKRKRIAVNLAGDPILVKTNINDDNNYSNNNNNRGTR